MLGTPVDAAARPRPVRPRPCRRPSGLSHRAFRRRARRRGAQRRIPPAARCAARRRARPSSAGRFHLGRDALPAARTGVAGRELGRGRGRRRDARRHRPQDPGAGARPGAHRRRAGGRGQDPLPRHHEPRTAHAAQRHHRLLRNDRAGRGADARCGAPQGIRAADQRFRPASAVGRQRHPRHVEDGIRQFRNHAGAVRAARGADQLLQPAGAEGARERHRSRDPRCPRICRS